MGRSLERGFRLVAFYLSSTLNRHKTKEEKRNTSHPLLSLQSYLICIGPPPPARIPTTIRSRRRDFCAGIPGLFAVDTHITDY